MTTSQDDDWDKKGNYMDETTTDDAGEDEGSAPKEGCDDHLKDDQKPTTAWI